MIMTKKKEKLTVLLTAASLFAFGTALTSYAASSGTWMMEDGEWRCYDANGDAYENTFCTSNSKEYFVGEDGYLVYSSWVECDGYYYYVNSAGQKIVNDWRLTYPYDDEDGDEEWYYFQSSGKMAENQKLVYKGKTYYFGSDGRMMTGWVTYDSDGSVDTAYSFEADNTYYCDETGARVQLDWVKTSEPGTDDDYDADEYWYYFKSTGKAAVGRQSNVAGQTYFFDTEGKMLSGWVALSATDSNTYEKIDGENSTEELTAGGKYYYCGDEEDGHMKKSKWIKLWRPSEAYYEDEDTDKYWYWIDSTGQFYVPADSSSSFSATQYMLTEGRLETRSTHGVSTVDVTKKKINSKDYFFNQYGEMLSQFIRVTDGSSEASSSDASYSESAGSGLYYLGGADDGAMKTGAISLIDDCGDSCKFYFYTSTSGSHTKGEGVTGNQNGKLYYSGMMLKSEDYAYQTVTLNGVPFIINYNGLILHGNVEYKEDGEILIDTKAETDSDGSVLYKVEYYSTASELAADGLDDSYKYGIRNIVGGDLKSYVPEINAADISGIPPRVPAAHGL